MQNAENNLMLIITFIMQLVGAKITTIPSDTDVMVGHSTFLNCSSDVEGSRIEWFHYQVGAKSDKQDVVYDGEKILEPYSIGSRFQVEKHQGSKAYNLVISNVSYNDAGLYVCQETNFVYAELNVIGENPTCQSDIKVDEVVGPNDCNIKPDEIRLSCGVSYYGNTFPQLKWIKTGSEESLKMETIRNSSHVTHRIVFTGNQNLSGSSFSCQTTRSKTQLSCSTDAIKIQYVYRGNSTVNKTLGDEVNCVANSSQPCKYRWIWFDGVVSTILNHNQSLVLKKSGWHKCEADCSIGNTFCTVESLLIYVPLAGFPLVYITFIVIIPVLCAVIGLIVFFVLRQKKKKQKKLRKKKKVPTATLR